MSVPVLPLIGVLLAAPPPEPEDLAAQAVQASERGDTATAARFLEQASVALPHHAGLLIELGTARARLGQAAPALEALERAAAMGVGADLPALDAAFGPARRQPDYYALRRRFGDNLSPLTRSTVAFRLPRDLLPESLAHDPADGAFYVGSMHRRKILRVDAGGAVRDLVPTARDGLAAVLGMKLDAARRELWVSSCNTAGDPPIEPAEPATARRGALFRYELPSGRLIRTYAFPALPGGAGGWRCFNDLALDPAGNVYLSGGGHALRMDRARDVVEPLAPAPGGLVNGIAVSDDGRTVFLATQTRGVVAVGVVAVGVASGATRPLDLPADATLNGIDGLYVRGRTLIGVQNGLRHGPERVVRATLDAALSRVERLEVLEQAHPAYAVPTTGVLVGDDFYYVAASNLEAVDENGRLVPEKLKDTVILRLPLSAAAGSCPPVDLEKEKADLLRIHALDRRAHFESDAGKLQAHGGPTFIYVARGGITHISAEEQRAQIAAYFEGATYHDWDDLEPPIVRVSDDASMAWMIVRTRVRRTQKDASGQAKETRFVYAGIMTYEKKDGRWMRMANVSTFEP